MAETITRQLREPFVEAAGTAITDRGLALLKDPIPTATYTGRQFVQDQSASAHQTHPCLLYTSPSPRARQKSRMPSSA